MIQITPRDRIVLLVGAAFVVIFILAQFVIFPLMANRDRLKRGVAAREKALVEMRELQERYRELHGKANFLLNQLETRNESFSLFSFLEQMAAKSAVKGNIAYMKPSETADDGPFKEVLVEMKLQEINLKQLVDFLKLIESLENVVALQRISIQESKKEKATLDVIMQVVSLDRNPGAKVERRIPVSRITNWFLSSLGYLLYTFMVCIVLLVILFPTDSFKVWLQNQLTIHYPSFRWELGEMHTGWPLSLIVSDVRLSPKKDVRTQVFQTGEIRIKPEVTKLLNLKGPIPFRYRIQALDGIIQGDLAVVNDRAAVICTGILQDLQVDQLTGIWDTIKRSGSGKLSGSFEYKGMWRNPLEGELLGNITVNDGSIGLQQPVLGLESLDFSRTTAKVSMKKRVVTLSDGEMESHLFAGSYNGTVSLSDSLQTSGLRIKGFFEPRPELLSGLNNDMAVSLIKEQLRNNSLSFSVSGTLFEPGILFQGLSGVIDGFNKRSPR